MNDREKTLEMKNWAVVGATDKKNKFGYKIYKKLKNHNYNVYPVNPNLETIDGDQCYPDLASVPVEIDVVDMVVNPRIGIKVMENIKTEGINYVWLQPGTRSSQIRDFAKNNKITIVESCVLINLD
ncbi:CoA-binding protein [Halanaerobium hydrogeniformans]|uniref:CoA-binding domain protein n=1 Tax=Halanaerobium hydrogeniformans TaxID=656519 RepID=E4RPB8_HALHG|nr:CoA-binding protein [Halanaerobium hydrogeniformans]ADQ13803.1 CoA-binding domain protein [Halanaerobium hydrogeniformans]